MGFDPKRGSGNQGIDTQLLPPLAFVAMPMQFAVMQSAKRDSVLVAHLASHRMLLSEFDVVGVRRAPSAGQTGMGSHEF